MDDAVVPMFAEDLQLDGADSRAIEWGDEVSPEVRADAHVVVIGCGESGLLTGIRLAQAGLPCTIIEKTEGPGGTWRDNRYPGARVDVGSHFYCYSFEPSEHWSEYFVRQPELRSYFERVLEKYDVGANCRFNTEVVAATWDEGTGRWSVEVREAARYRGHRHLRRTVVPLRPLGRLRRTRRPARGADRGWCQRVPARPGHRR